MQNNIITSFMKTDEEILELVNSIDFKQAMWFEEINNVHLFDFGALTIRVKEYPNTKSAFIIAIGDVPCSVDFKSYDGFITKLNDCKDSMRDAAVEALTNLRNSQRGE